VRAHIKVGRIAGISIGLHYSWFIIALLIIFSLADHFHSVTPQWNTRVIWTSAIITGLLFFAALLLHELAHSLVAKAYGLRVQAITLFRLEWYRYRSSVERDARRLLRRLMRVAALADLVEVIVPLRRADFVSYAQKLGLRKSEMTGGSSYARPYAWVLKGARRLKSRYVTSILEETSF
jgi:hypothetical protein